MIQASKLIPQGKGLAPVLVKRATTIELDWDVRQKSRFAATDSAGRELGIFLPRGTLVRGGDVLVAEDGSMVRVIAAPQPVLVITHCTQHGTPFDLTRAAFIGSGAQHALDNALLLSKEGSDPSSPLTKCLDASKHACKVPVASNGKQSLCVNYREV